MSSYGFAAEGGYGGSGDGADATDPLHITAPDLMLLDDASTKSDRPPKTASERPLGLQRLCQPLRQPHATAVYMGLDWLCRNQNPDGGWNLDGRPAQRDERVGAMEPSSDTSGTSLALLALMGVGFAENAAKSGKFGVATHRGLQWLVSDQQADGDLRGPASRKLNLSDHALATLLVCEAFHVTSDAPYRTAAQKAIGFLVANHTVAARDADERNRASRAGGIAWRMMALQSAIAAKLDVPEHARNAANSYLDSIQHDDGARYSYRIGAEPSDAATAEALLGRLYLGWGKQDPRLRQGVEHLLKHPPAVEGPLDVGLLYFVANVLHHMDHPDRGSWNRGVRELLVDAQMTEGDDRGSWPPQDDNTDAGNRLYVTAMSIGAIEVYYRHLPVYRPNDPAPKPTSESTPIPK
jgi:hypothetical protein